MAVGNNELTPPFLPQGVCCRITFNQEDITKQFDKIKLKIKDENKAVTPKFRVYLINRIYESYYFLTDFKMSAKLVNEKGMKMYKVKIAKEKYLQNHPSFKCYPYNKGYQYHKVFMKLSFKN